jgi:hypothetical protein
MKIELHVEQMVLHGFDPRDRVGIAEAVERELARLLRDAPPDANARDQSIARVDGGAFRIDAVRGDAAGEPIARAVHGAVAGPSR